jgi:Ca2+-binding RTX toxin-like protein
MASENHFFIDPSLGPSFRTDDFFPSEMTFVSGDDTQIVFDTPGGYRVVLAGAGLTYDVIEGTVSAIGGTVFEIRLTNAAGTTVFGNIVGNIVGINVGLVDLGNAALNGGPAMRQLVMAGDDTVIGGAFDDDVYTHGGNDSINAGGGFNFISPGGGADTINGSAGIDEVSYFSTSTLPAGVNVNLGAGTAIDPFGNTDILIQVERVRGTGLDDTLVGSSGNDRFRPLAGNDFVDGGAGTDQIRYDRDAQNGGGNAGVIVNLGAGIATDGFGNTDTLVSIEVAVGGNANDSLISGNDTANPDLVPAGNNYELYGLGGNDTLVGGSLGLVGTNFYGGAGNDSIVGSASLEDQLLYDDYTGPNGVVVNLATGIVNDPHGGTDTVSGIELVRGTGNADVFTGGAANEAFRGLAGADTMDGGAGFDAVRYDRDVNYGGNKGVYVDLGAGFAMDGFGSYDTFSNMEAVRGTNSLYPSQAQLSDVLLGSAGDNLFQALGGQDYVEGRGGNDTIFLGDGIDDIALGGAGNDSVIGGNGADFIYGNDGSDWLQGDAGDDWLFGGDFSGSVTGYDSMFGGDGNDVLAVGSAGGAASMFGGTGADTIYGGNLAGDDVIRGGTGSDFMWGGGGGVDTFQFLAGDLEAGDFDQILGFDSTDYLNFGTAFQGLVSGSDQNFGGVTGTYLTLAVSGGTWALWMPYTTWAQVQAQIYYSG